MRTKSRRNMSDLTLALEHSFNAAMTLHKWSEDDTDNAIFNYMKMKISDNGCGAARSQSRTPPSQSACAHLAVWRGVKYNDTQRVAATVVGAMPVPAQVQGV
eukprot:5993257-Amphidinium_carterae.5